VRKVYEDLVGKYEEKTELGVTRFIVSCSAISKCVLQKSKNWNRLAQ